MKLIYYKLSIVMAMLTVLLLAGNVFAQSGRPKVLVLRPVTAVDDKVVDKFQWDLAEALDKSGKFDIVKEGDYKDCCKKFNLDSKAAVPDSMVTTFMDTLHAAIYASCTLDQPGGKGTELSAKVDYYIPQNDFEIEGKKVSVANEDMTEDLAKKATEPLIAASERISLSSIARSYFNSAIYDKAIENYQKLLQLSPNDVSVYYMIGLSNLKAGNKDAAIAEFEKILADIDPNHKPSLEILATTYVADKNFEKALPYYQKLAELEPKNYEFTHWWAICLQQLGREDDAMKVFEKLVQIRDDDPAVRNMMGYNLYVKLDTLLKAGDTTGAKATAEKAIADFKRSIALDEEKGELADPQKKTAFSLKLFLEARSEMITGQMDSALATFTKLNELSPNYQNSYYYMAQITYDRKDWKKTMEYYGKVAELAPDNIKYVAYRRMASIYEKEFKQYNKAADTYTDALKVVPAKDKITVLFLRGAAYYDYANQLDFAADQNVDMDEKIQQGQMTTSRADQALSTYDKSEADMQKVTGKLAKNAKEHLDNIAQLRDRLNKIKQQIAYYEKTK